MAVYAGGNPQKQVTFDWIGEAFNEWKRYAGVWTGALVLSIFPPVIIFVAVFGVMGGIAAMTSSHSSAAALGVGMLGLMIVMYGVLIVFSLYVHAGLLKMAAKQLRGEPIDIMMVFSNGKQVLPVFAYGFVAGIAVGIGSWLCVFPGFIVTALLYPGLILVADGVPFSEALNRSMEGMKNNWLMGGVLALCCMVVYVLSVYTFVGFFITTPVGILIMALAARDMCGLPGASAVEYQVGYNAPTPGVWPPAPSTGFSPAQPSSPGFGSPVTPQTWPPQAEPTAEPQPQPPPAPGFGSPLSTPPPAEDETPPA